MVDLSALAAYPRAIADAASTPPVLPPVVDRTLADFVGAARAGLGDDLCSIVLYGSAADGTLRPASDVNVIIVMRRFDAARIDPPASRYDEATWIAHALAASGADLLLDLHNLHANAQNFGFDPIAFLDRLSPERIAAVHLAGGRLHRGRLVDDHLHDVPDPVYALLTEVARRATRPLTVVLERDGRYPPIGVLLEQIERAHAALAAGRAQATERAA